MPELTPVSAIAVAIRKLVNNDINTRDAGTQSAVIVTELSSAIAYSLQLPANPLDSRNDAERYYTQYHLPLVRKLVSDVNELFIIDSTSIQRIVHTLWMLRYRLVHEATGMGEVLTNLARISNLLPAQIIEKTLPFYNVGEERSEEANSVRWFGDTMTFNINKLVAEGIN